MKKKLFALILICVSLFSLAGCKAPEVIGIHEAEDDGENYLSADYVVGEAKEMASATENSRAYFTDSFDYNSLSEEEYESADESIFKNPVTSPLSTFSADVDTASYSVIRRFILDGNLPPADAVRTEEIINYFDYDLPLPSDGTPFSVTTELHNCPWNKDNLLLMLALKGEEITEKVPQNLVFLIDTSGSMHQDNRLPLIKKSIGILLDKLSADDTITIVTYAGSSGYALKPTKVKHRGKIIDAVNSLEAFGSTNGEAGIRLAYEAALENKVNGNNRIILCTDGDFNVGMTDNKELEALIEEKRELGIYLTVLGFGMGNYKDARMETLADKGNGNYAYIDSLMEAKRVLSDKLTGTLYTIADDVKFQAEFNPKKVKSYRLIGYDNRLLETEDFENDKKDAGEVGSGHTLVVLYEIVPGDATENASLQYQSVVDKGDLLTFRIRYKSPGEDKSKLSEFVIKESLSLNKSENFALAASGAELSLILKNSEFKGSASFESVIENARLAKKGKDSFGIRSEFLQVAELCRILYENAGKSICGYPKYEK
ncbi:MAG: von Willebrand factor type A domain-containing protein [Clostridia bacterium]|nr:von Willebrand factor type A domain-containing protein [Clostridia bacterium]